MPSDAEILRGYLIGDVFRPKGEWLYVALLHNGDRFEFTWNGEEWVRQR
jgi:hypothetical protein